MVIIDGDVAGLHAAVARVIDNPNPSHLREYELLVGQSEDIATLIAETLSRSAVVSYANDADAAMVCGISKGKETRVIWMTATRSAEHNPRWFLRNSRRCLAAGARFVGPGVELVQIIPREYAAGIRFAKRFGFCEKRSFRSKYTGAPLVVVAKEI